MNNWSNINKISIIIPVYNREKYIQRCLDSVLMQNVNKEIVIIDDGSTDSSLSIIKEYASKYPEIIYFQQENGGAVKARNNGISKSCGDYLFFLDSDDYLEENSLAEMLQTAIDNNADMVIGNFREADPQGNCIKEYYIPSYAKNTMLNEDTFWRLNSEDNTYVGSVICFRLYKKDLWKDLRFPEGVIHEDEFMQHLLVQRAQRIYVIDRIVETVSLSPESVMRKRFSKKNLALAKARAIRTRYLIDKGYYDHALYNFGFGTRTMLIGHNELSDSESKKEIEELYIDFKDIAKQLSPHIDFKNKIRLLLFRTNMDLYNKVRAKMRS